MIALACPFPGAWCQPTPTPLGDWRGEIRGPLGSWTVRLRLDRDARGIRAFVDFPDASAYLRAFEVSLRDSTLELDRALPGGGHMEFIGRMGNDSITGTWTGYGHTEPFELRRSATSPVDYRAELVTFRNGSVQLSGTLYLPQDAGRHRAMVCVHGSGPVERSVYAGKAAFLAGRGTATLVYDKRGTGQSTGDWQTASAIDLADDALAGVELLRHRPDIDASRVGVEGFSQGGWIAPLAATRSHDIAFVITGSASGINPAEQSVYDVAHQLQAAGFDSGVVAQVTTLRRRLYAGAEDSMTRVKLAADLESVHTAPWFSVAALPFPLSAASPSPGEIAFLHLDPPRIWENVRVPVLAYWGGRDTRVPPERSLEIVRTGLARAANRHVTLRVFPEADHVMTITSGPASGGWDFPRAVPYLTLIADWLATR